MYRGRGDTVIIILWLYQCIVTSLFPIGVDFYSRLLKMDDKIISLQMWDTAGQER